MGEEDKYKVWIVKWGNIYEGYSIVGIFSCENKAEELKTECEEQLAGLDEAYVISYYIDEVVDLYERLYNLQSFAVPIKIYENMGRCSQARFLSKMAHIHLKVDARKPMPSVFQHAKDGMQFLEERFTLNYYQYIGLQRGGDSSAIW